MVEKSKKLVSIIVPVYNGAEYVVNCSKYIEAQTYQNWEAFFVNDGSTDNTLQVCEGIISKNERFKLINKENGGTSRARNEGLKNANGEYVMFLDVDDEYVPTMIEKLVSLLEDNDVDMAICGYYFKIESEKGRNYLEEKNYCSSVYRSFDELKKKYVNLWDSDMLYNIWNKIYRKSVIDEFGIIYRPGHVYTEDRVFNRAFIEKSSRIAITNECLYYYIRERHGSTSEQYRNNYFEIRDKEYNELTNHFKTMELYTDEAREYISREFIERVVGTVENIFHAKDLLTNKEKKQAIQRIINHPDVIEACQYSRCRSYKMKLFAWVIKIRWVSGTYILGRAIFTLREISPELFHRIKSKR